MSSFMWPQAYSNASAWALEDQYSPDSGLSEVKVGSPHLTHVQTRQKQFRAKWNAFHASRRTAMQSNIVSEVNRIMCGRFTTLQEAALSVTKQD